MPIKYKPNYLLTKKIAECLARIEAVREKVGDLPLTPKVLASLRETARVYSTHYSTMIEGNTLNLEQAKKVIAYQGYVSGREREQKEVKGYYAGLAQVEQWAARGSVITEAMIQKLHTLVMVSTARKQTPYRDGQNVIRDAQTGYIVYVPPVASDVPDLMEGLMQWIRQTDAPIPIVAGIAHYQFATIHPYYDGNGRTARLLTTLLLHAGGYDLKGLYSLEEYYASNLGAYYEALSVGSSHNYYEGRAEEDITPWVEYVIEGMAVAFEKVLVKMDEAQTRGVPDQSSVLRKLDPQQRRALELFIESEVITSQKRGVNIAW